MGLNAARRRALARHQRAQLRATPADRPEVWIQGIYGLGDNVFQRPIVRAALANYRVVWLTTSWPELYADLADQSKLRFVRPNTPLRTQRKNVLKQKGSCWALGPRRGDRNVHVVSTRYMPPDLVHGSIVTTMENALPLKDQPYVFDLPPSNMPGGYILPQPYAVIRPVTERREWFAPARSPLPVYIHEAARLLQEAGYKVVSVADVDGVEEWHVGSYPPADLRFDHGELSVLELISVIRNAAVVVGGVGWLLPMAVAARTPCVMIGGGLGAHNHPDKVTDPRMGLEKLRWLLPDAFHMCGDKGCTLCPKTIREFPVRLQRTLAELVPFNPAPAARNGSGS